MKLSSLPSAIVLRGVVAALLFALWSVCGMVFAVELDFNGDGRADILWRNQGAGGTGENYFYPMNGTGILAGEGYVRTVSDMSWEIVAIGDFDGDQRADILWRNKATGQNYIYFMNGKAIVGEGFIRTVSDLNWKVVGVGDFNGDGRSDILWRNSSTGENYVYLMNGLSVLNEGNVRTVADQNWEVVGVGDFDGDVRADILWRNRATGANYIYFMNGTTIANEGYLRAVPDPNWKVVGIGDFDGDGRSDVLWRNSSTGENYIYPMQGLTIKPSEGYLRTITDQNWQVAAVGNFDGNIAPATADILWRNLSTGENYLYPMNGTAVLPSEGYLRTVADLNWKVQPASVVTSIDDALLTYSGTWLVASDPVKYQGSDHYSSSVGAMFSLTFTGTKIALIGALAPHHGIASVRLDAAPAVDADLYAATRTEGATWWTSPTLAAGQHTVVVTVTGRKNAASTSTVVSIDRVNITDGNIVSPPPPPPGQVQRPTYNTGTGFFVLGKTLYDANGYEFRIRGVNKTHYDAIQYDIVNRMGANAVRWVLWDAANTQAAQVAAARAWIAQKIVPIPGNWAATCNELPADLTSIVDLWVAQAASWTTADLQRYAIINIANEWGPANSTVWRDSYIGAIARLRNAGYKQTLMIDSGDCGQNPDDLLKYAQAVFDSDPQKNVVFSLHIYGTWARPATQSWQHDYDTLLAQMSLLNVPIVIGEFGPGRNLGPSPTPITPLEIMTTAEGYKWGWMPWAADSNNLVNSLSDDNSFDLLYNNFVYNSSADLTIFGKAVVDNAVFGLKAIAVKAVALTGTPPLP